MAHPKDFDLEDPKVVGAGEYRAIYDLLEDALDGCEDEAGTTHELVRTKGAWPG